MRQSFSASAPESKLGAGAALLKSLRELLLETEEVLEASRSIAASQLAVLARVEAEKRPLAVVPMVRLRVACVDLLGTDVSSVLSKVGETSVDVIDPASESASWAGLSSSFFLSKRAEKELNMVKNQSKLKQFLNTIRLLNYAGVAVGYVVCMADSVQRSDLNAENAIKLIRGRKNAK